AENVQATERRARNSLWSSAARPLARRQLRQQLEHLHVPRIGRRVVVGDLDVDLGGLQDERDAAAPAVGEEPAERIETDLALAEEGVAVAVAAEVAFAVVEVEERRRLTDGALEVVEDAGERRR